MTQTQKEDGLFRNATFNMDLRYKIALKAIDGNEAAQRIIERLRQYDAGCPSLDTLE